MDFDVISPGAIFRAEKEKDTKLWQAVKSYVDKGKNAPDDLTNEIVVNRLRHEHGRPQFIDGYPRSVGQVKALIQVPADYYVVHVDTPEDVCRTRALSDMRKRHDDNLEAFENKMKEYREKVLPALKVLRGMFGVVEVDGTKTDHQYAKVVKYCQLEGNICHTRAKPQVLAEYELWAKHLGHEVPVRAF
jgi:adenylate kinase